MKAAAFSLASAKYSAGENMSYVLAVMLVEIDVLGDALLFCRQMIIQSVASASYKVKMATENVVGVHLPVFEPVKEERHCTSACAVSKPFLFSYWFVPYSARFHWSR